MRPRPGAAEDSVRTPAFSRPGHGPPVWLGHIGRRKSLAGVVVSTGVPVRAATSSARQAPAPVDLTVDGLVAPLGVDDVPEFAWRLADTRRGATQSAYRVVVTTRPSSTGVHAHRVWDSGRVVSARQAFVRYGGPALPSDSAFSWTVQVWDQAGLRGPFARRAIFATALHNTDWLASWIRRAKPGVPDPDEYTFARREMTLSPATITRARAFVSGSHQFELWINGVRVAKGPSFSYPSEQYYQAVDVTSVLRAGAANAIGALYHWYGSGQGRPKSAPGLIVQLVVDHADGSRDGGHRRQVARCWRRRGCPPKRRNNDGGDYVESINGLAWPTGWDRPGSTTRSGSRRASAASTRSRRSRTSPGNARASSKRRRRRPIPDRVPTGSYVADFGVVIAAVPTVTFHHGVAGHVVPMHAGCPRPVGPDTTRVPGGVSITRRHENTDMSYSYVERAGRQTFHPFNYLGFRYLQIDDPGEPAVPSGTSWHWSGTTKYLTNTRRLSPARTPR